MVSEIAHIIPTHERPGVAQRLVDSINRQWPKSKIYVCDDSENPKVYQGAINVPSSAYDIGLSAKRNILVQKSQRPYIMLWDDDYIANEDTDLDVFYTLLTELEDVGIVGGEWIRSNGKRDVWFTGDFWVEGPVQKHEPPPEPPQRLSESGEPHRWHRVMYAPNWFLAARETLEAVPWDEELKLQEHTEFFARLAALRSKKGSSYDRDSIWEDRYRERSVGSATPDRDEQGRIRVKANTTFTNGRKLDHVGGMVSGGDWVYLEEDYVDELEEKGYVHRKRHITETRPFPIPDVDEDVPLGVAFTPDTTCLHMRRQDKSNPEKYNKSRGRDKFWPVQKEKLGTKDINFNQWRKYRYKEIDHLLPSECDTSLSNSYIEYDKS